MRNQWQGEIIFASTKRFLLTDATHFAPLLTPMRSKQIRIDCDAIALANKACKRNRRSINKEISFALVAYYELFPADSKPLNPKFTKQFKRRIFYKYPR